MDRVYEVVIPRVGALSPCLVFLVDQEVLRGPGGNGAQLSQLRLEIASGRPKVQVVIPLLVKLVQEVLDLVPLRLDFLLQLLDEVLVFIQLVLVHLGLRLDLLSLPVGLFEGLLEDGDALLIASDLLARIDDVGLLRLRSLRPLHHAFRVVLVHLLELLVALLGIIRHPSQLVLMRLALLLELARRVRELPPEACQLLIQSLDRLLTLYELAGGTLLSRGRLVHLLLQLEDLCL